ncbi:MAG: class I SAM-dependent methyltransferase [Gammaproteobacteria bacterium]|nr:class I SAM-dependent methyltransferase [Gammaproteobacteria bacterium]
MPEKPYSEYAERNAGPILEVLRNEFAACRRVLEIGSGTGQHAVRFARDLPHLKWQTSDRRENHSGIESWVNAAELPNLLPPLALDVLTDADPAGSWDAVFSANTAHIMSVAAVERMFAIVGRLLADGGVFCLYGPFRQGDKFNTESNAAFHETLRSRDPEMGIRHLEALDDFGIANDLVRVRLYAMPANNHLAVWIKGGL